MKTRLLQLAALLGFLFFTAINVMAQRPEDLGDRAMSAGQYEQALEYYQKAYEITNEEALTKKINLAQTLKSEFDAVNLAIKSKKFEEAESHLDNILLVDPENLYVQQKQNEIKEARTKEKRRVNNNKFERLTRGFRGSWPRHDDLGGLHFELGAAFSKYTPVDQDFHRSYRVRLYYSNLKYFPFTLDINGMLLGNYQSLGGGIGSSFIVSPKCTFNYGLGWQKNWYYADKVMLSESSNPYYNLGVTYMFENETFGGISYSYNHSIGNSEYPVASHNLTYVFGKSLSAYVGLLSLLVGLGIMGQYLK